MTLDERANKALIEMDKIYLDYCGTPLALPSGEVEYPPFRASEFNVARMEILTAFARQVQAEAYEDVSEIVDRTYLRKFDRGRILQAIRARAQELERKCGLCYHGNPCNFESCPDDIKARATEPESTISKGEKCCCWSFDHPPCPIHNTPTRQGNKMNRAMCKTCNVSTSFGPHYSSQECIDTLSNALAKALAGLDAMALIADDHAMARVILSEKNACLEANVKDWEETAMETAKELAETLAALSEMEYAKDEWVKNATMLHAECAKYREWLEVIARSWARDHQCSAQHYARTALNSQNAGKAMLEVVEAAREYQDEMANTGGAGPDRVIKALKALDNLK